MKSNPYSFDAGEIHFFSGVEVHPDAVGRFVENGVVKELATDKERDDADQKSDTEKADNQC